MGYSLHLFTLFINKHYDMFIIIIKFTPLIVYIDGVLGREAECFMPFLVEEIEKNVIRSCRMDVSPGCPLPF